MKKVILITGASRGIGAAVAREAAHNGYDVAINYRTNRDMAIELSEELNTLGAKTVVLQGDVSQEEDVLRMFDETKKHLGTIDALVNNAGIITPLSLLENMDLARIRKVFETNVYGTMLCSREAVKYMSTKSGGNGGTIVNVSSVAARLGSPYEFVDYAASKGAVDTFTIGLAVEVAEAGIRVNAVRPGLIDTDMHGDTGDPNRAERLKANIPMKRIGSADEVAKTILWLLSEDASYITGSIMDVSGGR